MTRRPRSRLPRRPLPSSLPSPLPALLLALPFFAAFSTLSACSPYALTEAPVPPVAAFGPAPRTDVATVCVIRPSHFAVGVTFVVHDDGQLVGATRGESWFCYWAAPGRHDIVSSTGDAVDRDGKAELTAEPGRRYWLHQDYENLFGVIVDELQWVNEERAHALLEDGSCGYKTLAGVPGGEKLPAEVPLAAAR